VESDQGRAVTQTVTDTPPLEPLVAEQRDWLVCHDCGALQPVVPVAADLQLVCGNCETPLYFGRGPWLDKTTALTVAALILFIGAHVFDFFTLVIGGSSQTITILSGAGALITREEWLLAGLVLMTTFLLPMFEIFALLYLLLPYRFNRRLPGQLQVLRWLERVQHWIMHDVFLLGVLVTTVKLGDRAIVQAGPALPLFFLLVAALQAGYWFMDKRNLWSWLYPNNCFTRRPDEALYDCEICKAMVGESILRHQGHCPRCSARIHTRIPQSLQKTTALILAAVILYVPANLYLIMYYDELGVSYDSTILSGVFDLAANNLWLIAIIVFVASVVVPVLKLMMLSWLVWSVHRRHTGQVRLRRAMYRVTKVIGRWSMVDVFVVTLLTAVVQFGLIGQVEPGAALLPFAAVVVLTMLAVETFDPRLIWDTADTSAGREPTLAQLNADGLAIRDTT
jgi:paraquat-inducible protein A